jgi:hypothetical protein
MDLSTKTARELIVELKHIEDALRGALPVTLPEPLRERVVARQEEICAELRRRFGGGEVTGAAGRDVIQVDHTTIAVLATTQGPDAPLPEPA